MANHNPAGFPVQVGINNVGSYQVSGRPFATGSCQAATVSQVNFPYVTRWVTIVNNSSRRLRVSYSHEGLNLANTGSEGYHFTVPASGSLGPLEMKVSSLWFIKEPSSSADSYNNLFDVVAGLTTIDPRRTDKNFTGSYTGV